MPALDELGWLQFERLCELVLEADAGVDPARWDGAADTTREFVSEDPLTINGLTLAPPVRVRCTWLRGDERAVRVARRDRFRSHVLFVNRPAGDFEADLVYGTGELCEAIRRLPEIRLRLPSVLSLDAVVPDPAALERSTLDLEATRELASVFVSTPAWAHAVAVLREHHFLVLTGPPEMGKTAIARMLGMAKLA